jgi:hypothetical protein
VYWASSWGREARRRPAASPVVRLRQRRAGSAWAINGADITNVVADRDGCWYPFVGGLTDSRSKLVAAWPRSDGVRPRSTRCRAEIPLSAGG